MVCSAGGGGGVCGMWCGGGQGERWSWYVVRGAGGRGGCGM